VSLHTDQRTFAVTLALPFSVNVHVWPPAGATVNPAVRVTPAYDAEIVTGVDMATGDVVAVNVALVAPSGTVTPAGIDAAVLLERLTTAPPACAAPLRTDDPQVFRVGLGGQRPRHRRHGREQDRVDQSLHRCVGAERGPAPRPHNECHASFAANSSMFSAPVRCLGPVRPPGLMRMAKMQNGARKRRSRLPSRV
jgi:hypothetical protein